MTCKRANHSLGFGRYFRYFTDRIYDSDDILMLCQKKAAQTIYRRTTGAVLLVIVESIQSRKVVLDHWKVVDIHALETVG